MAELNGRYKYSDLWGASVARSQLPPELPAFVEEELDELRQQMRKQNREAYHEKQRLIYEKHQVCLCG